MSTINRLTSGKVLARSTAWNLLGMGGPILVALIAIPLLIGGMGTERFGLLAIIWMGVGYFSLFDLGLGRALTKLVSERIGQNDESDLGDLIWTGLALLVLFGTAGALLLSLASEAIVTSLLKVPVSLHDEASLAFRVLALSIPVVIFTAGLIGLLEAHQRFGSITAVRIPLGILTFAGPLMTLQVSPNIALATASLLAARVIAMIVYYRQTIRIRPELREPRWLQRMHVRPLLSFGGWLTVTNIVGPIMTYLDRFFIGAILGLQSVAYYVTPYDVLSRMQMLPQAIIGVMFPAMTMAHHSDRERLNVLYRQTARVIYWPVLVITTSCFLIAPEALQLWLGEEFRVASTPVVHWLAAGLAMNGLARPALTMLQSAGRPDLTAKAHLFELLPYLSLLWYLAHQFGISGVAAAWAVRAAADMVILNVLVALKVPELLKQIRHTLWVAGVTLLLFCTLFFIGPLMHRLLAALAVATVATWFIWPIVSQAFLKESTQTP